MYDKHAIFGHIDLFHWSVSFQSIVINWHSQFENNQRPICVYLWKGPENDCACLGQDCAWKRVRERDRERGRDRKRKREREQTGKRFNAFLTLTGLINFKNTAVCNTRSRENDMSNAMRSISIGHCFFFSLNIQHSQLIQIYVYGEYIKLMFRSSCCCWCCCFRNLSHLRLLTFVDYTISIGLFFCCYFHSSSRLFTFYSPSLLLSFSFCRLQYSQIQHLFSILMTFSLQDRERTEREWRKIYT